ncbi:MAG: hypothetical protein LBH92_09410, partial [Bacteroidales bacterium]|nr:hypothetical protein [Bacteroidales bacterium]
MKRFLLTVLISGLLLPVFAQRDEQKIKETALESGFYHEVKKSTSPNNSRESAIPLNASSIMEDFIDDDVSVKVIYLKG